MTLWLLICATCLAIGFLAGRLHWESRRPFGLGSLAAECAQWRRRADEAEEKLDRVARAVRGIPL